MVFERLKLHVLRVEIVRESATVTFWAEIDNAVACEVFSAGTVWKCIPLMSSRTRLK